MKAATRWPPAAAWAMWSGLGLGWVACGLACAAHDQRAEIATRLNCLSQALATGDPQRREAAAEDLADFGADAAPAVPALIRALADESAEIELRRQFVVTLERIGPSAHTALPLLLALHAREEELRVATARAAAAAGAPAAARIRRLLRAHPSTETRVGAAMVLADNQDESVTTALLAAVQQDTSAVVRGAAAQSLAARKSPQVVQGLSALLEGDDWELALQAAQALHRRGDLALLRRALLHGGLVASLAAAAVLDELAPAAVRRTAWIAATRDPRDSLRAAAAQALGRLGGADASVVAVLQALLSDPSTEVQRAADDALSRLEQP